MTFSYWKFIHLFIHHALHAIRGTWLKMCSGSKMPMWNQYNDGLIDCNGLWQVTAAIHIYIHIYIYIERERESKTDRQRERKRQKCHQHAVLHCIIFCCNTSYSAAKPVSGVKRVSDTAFLYPYICYIRTARVPSIFSYPSNRHPFSTVFDLVYGTSCYMGPCSNDTRLWRLCIYVCACVCVIEMGRPIDV